MTNTSKFEMLPWQKIVCCKHTPASYQGSFVVGKKQSQPFITVPYFFVFTWSYGVILGLLTYKHTDLSATLRHLFCLHFHHLHHHPSSALLNELKVSSNCSPVSSVGRVPEY